MNPTSTRKNHVSPSKFLSLSILYVSMHLAYKLVLITPKNLLTILTTTPSVNPNHLPFYFQLQFYSSKNFKISYNCWIWQPDLPHKWSLLSTRPQAWTGTLLPMAWSPKLLPPPVHCAWFLMTPLVEMWSVWEDLKFSLWSAAATTA